MFETIVGLCSWQFLYVVGTFVGLCDWQFLCVVGTFVGLCDWQFLRVVGTIVGLCDWQFLRVVGTIVGLMVLAVGFQVEASLSPLVSVQENLTSGFLQCNTYQWVCQLSATPTSEWWLSATSECDSSLLPVSLVAQVVESNPGKDQQ